MSTLWAARFWWIFLCIGIVVCEFCTQSKETLRWKRHVTSTLEQVPQLLIDFEGLFLIEDYEMAKQSLVNIIGNVESFLDPIYSAVNAVNKTDVTADGKLLGEALEKMNHMSAHTTVSFDNQYLSTVHDMNQMISLFTRYLLYPGYTTFILTQNRCKKLMPNFSLHWMSRYLSQCCFLRNLVRARNYELMIYVNIEKQIVFDAVKAALSTQMCLGLASDLMRQTNPSLELISNEKNHAIRDINEIMANLNEYEAKLVAEFDTDEEYGLNRTLQNHFSGKTALQEIVSGLYQKLSKLYSYVNWAVFCLDDYHAEGKFIKIGGKTCDAIIHYTRSSLQEQQVNADRLKNAINKLDKSFVFVGVRDICLNLTEILKPTGQQMILTFEHNPTPKSISKMHITQRYNLGNQSYVIVFG